MNSCIEETPGPSELVRCKHHQPAPEPLIETETTNARIDVINDIVINYSLDDYDPDDYVTGFKIEPR